MKQLHLNWRNYLTLILVVSTLSGCLKEDNQFEKQIDFEENLLKDYFTNNGITAVRDNSGLYYEILKEDPNGTPVEEQDIVSLRYVLKNLNGKLIDSLSASQSVDTLVQFHHIGGAIYPEGINFGVRLMNVGEKLRLYIPSYRGFGNFSYKTIIPSETILIAEVEVVDVHSLDEMKELEKQSILDYVTTHTLTGVEEQSSEIFYQMIEDGTGNTVQLGQQIELAYKGYYLDGEVFDESKQDQPIKFTLGYSNIIKGLEDGIKLMKKGEKGRIFIPSHLAYGSGIQVIPDFVRKSLLSSMNKRDIAPFKTLIFDVELEDID